MEIMYLKPSPVLWS